MLAIKDLNNITRFEKPVPVILNRTELPNVYDCLVQSQAGYLPAYMTVSAGLYDYVCRVI